MNWKGGLSYNQGPRLSPGGTHAGKGERREIQRGLVSCLRPPSAQKRCLRDSPGGARLRWRGVAPSGSLRQVLWQPPGVDRTSSGGSRGQVGWHLLRSKSGGLSQDNPAVHRPPMVIAQDLPETGLLSDGDISSRRSTAVRIRPHGAQTNVATPPSFFPSVKVSHPSTSSALPKFDSLEEQLSLQSWVTPIRTGRRSTRSASSP